MRHSLGKEGKEVESNLFQIVVLSSLRLRLKVQVKIHGTTVYLGDIIHLVDAYSVCSS